MPKSILYTLTFTKHLGSGSWSFSFLRSGTQISECLEQYSSLDICRQKAYSFLCFAIQHYHDRDGFRLTEREVREGTRKDRKFAPIIDFDNSNLAPSAFLSSPPLRDKPHIIPSTLDQL